MYVVSDRDSMFIGEFWLKYFESWKLLWAWNPPQNIEDMVCAYVPKKPSKWEHYLHLPLEEFAYNNSKHTSTKCGSFFVDVWHLLTKPLDVYFHRNELKSIQISFSNMHEMLHTAWDNVNISQMSIIISSLYFYL